MRHKYYHNKIAVKLNELLSTHKAFKDNWKAIDPARRLLEYVANRMNMNDGKMVEIYSPNIKAIFLPYTNGSYVPYLAALVDLRLLVIDHEYVSEEDANDGVGRCKKYAVTDLALDLINDTNQQYLHLLHTDKELKRSNKKSISKRKVMQHTYNDYLMEYMNDLQKHLRYRYQDAKEVLETIGDPLRCCVARQELIKIEEKDYNGLKYCDSNGRLISDYTNMMKDVRNILTYKSLVRVCVVDIRACHPTYFSSYLLYVIYPSLPYHNVGNKGDTYFNQMRVKQEKEKQLEKEHWKWVRLWTDERNDVRDDIAERFGKTKEQVKDAINKTMNGSGYYPFIGDWIRSEFPLLYELWSGTDTKTTGVGITRQFEAPLMQDKTLYEYIDEMGLKIGYENDGFSVFASLGNTSIRNQMKFIIGYIQFRSKQKWGVVPILKCEWV